MTTYANTFSLIGDAIASTWKSLSATKKKVVYFILAIALVLGFASCAHAGGKPYVPLQPAHTGLWADPLKGDAGFSINVIGSGPGSFAQVAMYAGSYTSGSLPFWTVAYPPFGAKTSGEQTLWIWDSMFHSYTGASLVSSGTLSITSLGCESLDLTVDVTGQSPAYGPVTYHLQPFTQPLLGDCYTAE